MSFEQEWERFSAKYPVMGTAAKIEFRTHNLKKLLRDFYLAGAESRDSVKANGVPDWLGDALRGGL